MNYVVFGVNIGNLGRSDPEGRPTSAELCRRWNEAFRRDGIPFTVRPAYRATGNFFLNSDEERSVGRVAETLRITTKRSFAVFPEAEFLSLVSDLEVGLSQRPESRAGRRMTPGVVMDTQPGGAVPPVLSGLSHAVSDSFARLRVRGVWKLDRLRADGKALDSAISARDGGWGAIARAMQRQHGGAWTARALSTLRGVASRMGPRAGARRRSGRAASGAGA
ncbi:MAG: hypothetical protein HY725_21710 [Candidatus Rokubacteria bacterium]|nr:hypothetical protein [Candidatus Rokubacteria bacterium]